jgi:hypothetical protein
MAVASSNLKASASFDVRPARSQVVLVALTVMAIISLIFGGGLFIFDKLIGWLFVAISIILGGVVVWCWLKSHRDTDLAQSHPTKYTMADGSHLSTDSRLLSTQDGAKQLAHFLELFALRQPLPEPSGTVNSNLLPIPNSTLEATERVKKLNEENQLFHDQTLTALRQHLGNGTVTQILDNSAKQPPTATPDDGKLNGQLIERSPQ